MGMVVCRKLPWTRCVQQDRIAWLHSLRETALTALSTAALTDVATWPMELREDFEERAAVMEFDGGLPRMDAEVESWRLLRTRVRPAC